MSTGAAEVSGKRLVHPGPPNTKEYISTPAVLTNNPRHVDNPGLGVVAEFRNSLFFSRRIFHTLLLWRNSGDSQGPSQILGDDRCGPPHIRESFKEIVFIKMEAKYHPVVQKKACGWLVLLIWYSAKFNIEACQVNT